MRKVLSRKSGASESPAPSKPRQLKPRSSKNRSALGKLVTSQQSEDKTTKKPHISTEAIRERAYSKFVARGCEDCGHLDVLQEPPA